MIEQLQKDPRKKNSPILKQLLLGRPKLNYKMQLALNAFNVISRSRNYVGQMASPCPLSECDIIKYIELHGVTCYEPDIFMEIIISLDNEWLRIEADRRKREQK